MVSRSLCASGSSRTGCCSWSNQIEEMRIRGRSGAECRRSGSGAHLERGSAGCHFLGSPRPPGAQDCTLH
uniref:Uncharacterized protein n=1 Tax=Anguilla anguilla TaxID=7936 RepID=A0A0E9Y1I0_ANGAN